MFKIYEQSYEIYFSNSSNKVMGFGMAPPVPEKWTDVLVRKDYTKTTTVFEFKTEVKHNDGTVCVYYRKPTMQWIMDLKDVNNHYVRFYDDGSVEHGINGEYYRWGPDVPFVDQHGEYYEPCECRECLGDYGTGPEDDDEIVENMLKYGKCYNPNKTSELAKTFASVTLG